MWKYELGDTVKIRSDFADLRFENDPGVVREMHQFADTECTIKEKCSVAYRYRVFENPFVWDQSWLEQCVNAIPFTDDEFMNMFGG